MSVSPPSTPSPSLLASSLLDQTLSDARRRLGSSTKGKGKLISTTKTARRRRRRSVVDGQNAKTRLEPDSDGEETVTDTSSHSPDHPPTYGEAIEQRESQPSSQRRRRRNSTRPRSPALSSSSAEDTEVGDSENDALSNLLTLTTSLIASSSSILSASKDLHSQLSQFLLSSSPPSASSANNLLLNDVRSELGLNGDNWDRLNRLERDVERFGMKKEGKDPRSQLLAGAGPGGGNRRVSTNQPVVGVVTESGMGIVEEEEELGNFSATAETRAGSSIGLGRPPTSTGVNAATSVEAASAVAKKGHLRRSSTAQDLLRQLSSSSISTPASSKFATSTPSPTTAALSRRPSTSLDSPRTPATSHRLSISPSLPSLSSSSSTSSLPHSTLTSPSLDQSFRSTSHTIPTPTSKGLSLSPSLSSVLSVSNSNTSLSTSPIAAEANVPSTSPSHAHTMKRSPSLPHHRRSSTIVKSMSVVKLDENPLGSLEESTKATLPTRVEVSGGGGVNAAAERLRNLQTGIESGKSNGLAGAAGGGSSWWGWR
ncbi:uncharacterized protein JCM6883_002316 [Sporobolomyces salmoneus]|uniref:uncharacterized protein n=1 Tax=Sporobolomyces salmoneus TaxID=183962 RepID=UPI00317C2B94